jgi:hypothetical protein
MISVDKIMSDKTRKEKINELAEFIWAKSNEIDFDQNHPRLCDFDDKIKDDIFILCDQLIMVKEY